MEQTCKTCKFLFKKPNTVWGWFCRRYPPSYPEVQEDDYCGEYQVDARFYQTKMQGVENFPLVNSGEGEV